MKKLLIPLFIVCLVYFGFGCNEKKRENPIQRTDIIVLQSELPVFHVRVKPHSESCDYWYIQFTNDNFVTYETINETWDASDKYAGNRIVKQLALFQSEAEAVIIAKKFNTYKKCISYNDTVELRYKRLSAYRADHPIEKEPLFIQEAPKCAPTSEIIVY